MLIEKWLKRLPGIPEFRVSPYFDENPLSGRKKKRDLEVPNEAMRVLHRRMVSYLRRLPISLEHSTGARPGNSPLKNIEPHRKNRFFFLVDLQSAYHQVDIRRLAEILFVLSARDLALSSNLAESVEALCGFLQKYCASKFNGLPIGAPASPDLFVIYTAKLLDEPLHPLCLRHGLTYTRYLDDLTFSSPDTPIGVVKREQIREIIAEAGFQISHHKCKVLDLQKGAIEINGIGLACGGRIFVPRHYLRRLRGIIHLGIKNPDDKKLRNTISGMWGVFKTLTRRRYNRTEAKVANEFSHLRRLWQSRKAGRKGEIARRTIQIRRRE